IMRGNQLVVANVGDSRCVISRKGEAYNLSRDHKPGLEVDRDRILKAGGFIHAGRVNGSLNLTRAIGDMEFKQNKFLSAEKQILQTTPSLDAKLSDICIGTSAANNPTLVAISEVTKEITRGSPNFFPIKPTEYGRFLVLSLGTGSPEFHEKYDATKSSSWGVLGWLSGGGSTPLV
ncbi:acyl transferase/acyl hydrolase/lysophospholipase, partial [Tanacetum coccineum]